MSPPASCQLKRVPSDRWPGRRKDRSLRLGLSQSWEQSGLQATSRWPQPCTPAPGEMTVWGKLMIPPKGFLSLPLTTENNGAHRKWTRRLRDWINPWPGTSDSPWAFGTSPWKDEDTNWMEGSRNLRAIWDCHDIWVHDQWPCLEQGTD